MEKTYEEFQNSKWEMKVIHLSLVMWKRLRVLSPHKGNAISKIIIATVFASLRESYV